MSEENHALRRSSAGGGRASTRTGQALISSLGAFSNAQGGGGGLNFVKKESKDEKTTETKPPAATRINKFSADKLVSIVQETSAPSFARLRKSGDTNKSADGVGDLEPVSKDKEISDDISSSRERRRTPPRTMSAQNPRTNSRRLRSNDNALEGSLGDYYEEDVPGMDGSSVMDASVVSSASRRRMPARSRSAVDCLPRGSQAGSTSSNARPPRSRRRAEKVEDDDDGPPPSPRKRVPLRAKSADDLPRGYERRSRPGRKKPGRNSDNDDDDDGGDDDGFSGGDESVEISDSDLEAERGVNDRSSHSQDIDRSSVSQSSRRRLPQRSRSLQDSCLPRSNERYDRRRARRRGTNDEDDEGSPKRGTGAPPIQRTNTADRTNPRSARGRAARNTAAELAVVESRRREREEMERQEREREHSPESPVPDRSGHGKGQISPIKSREERRRLREAKERETMERRVTMGHAASEKPKKKEEPWMRRRLQKAASGDDSFAFEDAFSQDGGFPMNDKKGSSLPRLDQSEDFFQTDEDFGAFP